MKTKSLCSIFIALGCLLSSGCGMSDKEYCRKSSDLLLDVAEDVMTICEESKTKEEYHDSLMRYFIHLNILSAEIRHLDEPDMVSVKTFRREK